MNAIKSMYLILLVLILLIFIYSCADLEPYYKYEPQNITRTNYNNLTAKNSNLLITSNAIYHSSHVLDFAFYEVSENGSEHIFSHGLSGALFDYNDCIYLSANNEFVEYDLTEDEKQVLFEFAPTRRIESYFILDDVAYLNVCYDAEATDVKKLYTYDFGTKALELFENGILSIGVMDGNPVYIIKNDHLFEVFQCDARSGASKPVGSFELVLNNNVQSINYTSQNVVICYDNSFVAVYNVESGSLRIENVGIDIFNAVAYDDYLYLSDISKVYRYCIETQALSTVCTVDDAAYPNIYVISDTEVCVILSMDDIRLYHPDGTYEKLTKRVQNPNSVLTKGALT